MWLYLWARFDKGFHINTMTEKQTKIADRLLGILVEHDGRVNKDGARSILLKEFAERMDRIDINFVFD